MIGFARVVHELGDGDFRILWGGRFDVPDSALVTTARALIDEHIPDGDDFHIDPAEYRLYVWPVPPGEEPKDNEDGANLVPDDAILHILGNIVLTDDDRDFSELEELLGRLVKYRYLSKWEMHDVGVILFRVDGNPLGMAHNDAFYYARGALAAYEQQELSAIKDATEKKD